MRLSPNFTLNEACKSQTALRCGIDNTPPPDVAKNLVRVAESILEPVRAHFGKPFSPSSWYRSPALNERIGSKPTSHHVSGRAVDFEVPGIANTDLASWCASNVTFDQLILEFYREDDPSAGWVHCSIAGDGEEPRQQILTITREGVTEGLPE